MKLSKLRLIGAVYAVASLATTVMVTGAAVKLR